MVLVGKSSHAVGCWAAVSMISPLFPVCNTRFPAAGSRQLRATHDVGSGCGALAEKQDESDDAQRAHLPVREQRGRASPMGEHAEVGQNLLGLVTWNVNGLLPCIKRMGLKNLGELLDSFPSSVHIVCLQESKMQRSQLDQTLARPNGWDAFYSFSHLPPSVAKVHGYSGTVTFVRQASRPIDAREGFTSMCCLAEMPDLLKRLALYGAGTASCTSSKQEVAGSEVAPDSTSSSRKRKAADEKDDGEERSSDVGGVGDVDGGGLLELLCATTPDHLRDLDSEVLARALARSLFFSASLPGMFFPYRRVWIFRHLSKIKYRASTLS